MNDQVLVAEIVAHLADQMNTEPAATFPADRNRVDHPGLYAWWASPRGLAILAESFGEPLSPLIYAGQAGAASSRAGKIGKATLRSRIGGQHLRGNIGSSTFRRTLAAALRQPLALEVVDTKRLSRESNLVLTHWIHEHLAVATVAHDDRIELNGLEKAVLGEMDPPLNLRDVADSPVRRRLTSMRAALR